MSNAWLTTKGGGPSGPDVLINLHEIAAVEGYPTVKDASMVTLKSGSRVLVWATPMAILKVLEGAAS